jgi:hypothetical protein
MMLPPKVNRSTIAAEPGVGDGFCPAGERFVGGDRDAGFHLALGENLEQHFGAAFV